MNDFQSRASEQKKWIIKPNNNNVNNSNKKYKICSNVNNNDPHNSTIRPNESDNICNNNNVDMKSDCQVNKSVNETKRIRYKIKIHDKNNNGGKAAHNIDSKPDTMEPTHLVGCVGVIDRHMAMTNNTINNMGKPIYDVNCGFMLAESYYDSDKNPIINPIGWWVSEKYDGVRAIWNGIQLYTRNLTEIIAPTWFISQLPKNFSIDGELYIKRNFFNETSGYVRKKTPIDFEWENIKFMAFDVPHLASLPFENRMDRLKSIIASYSCKNVIIVPQIKIESLDKLMKLYKEYTDSGAEGLMLHKPNSPYIPRRCNMVLKLKVYSDEESYITGWQEGSGKNYGKLGALLIKWKNPNLIAKKYKLSVIPIIEFKVGSGFKDTDRCPIKEASIKYPIGTTITIGFNGLQNSGKPRHPTFKGIKWDT
jgi:DNA ligase-1